VDDALERGLGAPSAHNNLAWLVRLRWGAVASQLLTIAVVSYALTLPLAHVPLLSCVALAALSNVLCVLWQRRAAPVSQGAIAGVMALDHLLLTALLYFAGGPMNPFSVLYLVHVALSAAILEARLAWALAVLSVALFGTLFFLPVRHDAVMHAMGMHGHAGAVGLHVQGMWVAFAIAAFFIVYFVTRIARDLTAERAAAEKVRARAARSEKLASLATLAAGAAHELGTPLSTIAVVAKELEHGLAESTPFAHAASDARTIREEVERCRVILARMAQDAGETMGEAFDTGTLAQLAEAALEGVRGRERVRVSIARDGRVRAPQRALAQALRALLKNALEASEGPVELELSLHERHVQVRVLDRGVGMDETVLKRVGEPFFSTKPTGRGMGLGVFLARALFERLEGELVFESRSGAGTEARATFSTGSSRASTPKVTP
jgi:two-component system sensor histidine kinase RegB